MPTTDDMLEEIESLVGDQLKVIQRACYCWETLLRLCFIFRCVTTTEHATRCCQVVSYKWLARNYAIPYDTAKHLLLRFLEGHRDKVSSVFMVAGFSKDAQRRHLVSLVEGDALAAYKSKLAVVTSEHVFSLQPSKRKVWSSLLGIKGSESIHMFIMSFQLVSNMPRSFLRMHRSCGTLTTRRRSSCSKSS